MNQQNRTTNRAKPVRTTVSSPKVVSSISVVSVGDLLISQRILNGAYQPNQSGGSWDFHYIFRYVQPYIKDADYAVINLETCFAGDKEEFCGFPRFNTPLEAFQAARDAGFDMFLTASNHTYDMGYDALIHKIRMLENAKADYIGTRRHPRQALHKVVDVNGIRIGMLNYAKETAGSTKDRVILNTTRTGPDRTWESAVLDDVAQKLIATYNNKYLDVFYNVLEKDIQILKKKGADIIVAYPHWGTQYNIHYQPVENSIAQKMCDLGVDLIIGGHPHVVQPTTVYTSPISGKTTLCIHSTGNFVSSMNKSVDATYGEYTKDGVIFKYTAKKYTDGSVVITSAEALPIWVYANKGHYTVIPLDRDVNWKDAYSIADYSEQRRGYESYNRTTGLVEKNIAAYNSMAKIAMQPKDAMVYTGGNAEFHVSAVGKNITYQWQRFSEKGGNPKWINVALNSADTPSLKICQVNSAMDGFRYRCVVSTPSGTVWSRPAQLTVKKQHRMKARLKRVLSSLLGKLLRPLRFGT